jgi:hypothetical protein
MLLLDGKQLVPGRPFTHNGIQYPANWLRLTSWEEKSAIGITEVPDPAPVDTRFYWDHNLPKQLEDEEVVVWEDVIVDGVGIGSTSRTYTQTGLKTQWKKQQDETAYSLLAPTDWYVVRKSEVGTEIPVGITSFRVGVRDISEQRKSAIGLATDVPSLVGIVTFHGLDWPTI